MLLRWYAADDMMSRCIALTDHPLWMNSTASQSSSSGWVGGSPRVPNSLGVGTSPVPKWCCHSRFAMTRAVRRFSGC